MVFASEYAGMWPVQEGVHEEARAGTQTFLLCGVPACCLKSQQLAFAVRLSGQ